MDTYIIIGTNGFVWAGRMSSMDTKDGFYTIYKACQIREWGTTKGLNELIAGPTNVTKLDAIGPILYLHQAHTIALIPTDKTAWDKHL